MNSDNLIIWSESENVKQEGRRFFLWREFFGMRKRRRRKQGKGSQTEKNIKP